MSAGSVDNSRLVLICCRKPDAFRRAHAWALNRGLTSLLLTTADWPSASSLALRFAAGCLITDAPDDKHFGDSRIVDARTLQWEPPAAPESWPEPVAILFTGGSTGTPKAIAKNARAIQGEFALLKQWFSSAAPLTDFICTVPLEHMFGYTFGFWLPIFMQAALHEKRPFIPADLRNACRAATQPAWIVTTPTHLRAYVQLRGGFNNVAGLICATSALSTELACAAASCFNAPITEIYGSTETGVVAARIRTADERTMPSWTPLPGISVAAGSTGTAICRIPHLEDAVELGDLIAMDGPRFKILGRTGDMVKICGKRHSLAALNQALAAAPGVLDSAYFIPESSAPAENQRAAAFVVLSREFSIDKVLDGLRGKVDDVFLPRPIYSVDSIPRTDAGKLRAADLQSMFRSLQAAAINFQENRHDSNAGR